MTAQMISDIAAQMTVNKHTVLKRGQPDTLVISKDADGDALVRTESIPDAKPDEFRLMLMYEIGFRWFLGLPGDDIEPKLATLKAIAKTSRDIEGL